MPLILYIDGDAHYAHIIRTLLASRGFGVATAQDGPEGVRKARELQPDLILLDLSLPRVGSKSLVSRLRSEALTCHIPIVLMSALPISRGCPVFQGAGIDDIVPKPFRLDELLSAIRNKLPACGPHLPATPLH